MTEQNQNKKALWIFPNFKESIDELPKSQRALVWQAVCEIGLGYDFDIKKCTTSQKMCIKMIYPLLKLRNIGGSIVNGEKRNPDGKNGLNTCNKTILEDNPYPNPQENIYHNPKDNPLYKNEIEYELEKEKENKNINKLIKKMIVKEGQYLIDENFNIFSLPEIEIYKKEVGQDLLLSVQKWLLEKKNDCVVDKEFIYRQIVNFSKRKGLL